MDWTRALQILKNIDDFLKGPGTLRPGVILIGTPLMTMSKSAVCNMNEDFVAEHGSSARFSFPCTTKVGTKLKGGQFLFRAAAKSAGDLKSGGVGLQKTTDPVLRRKGWYLKASPCCGLFTRFCT